MARVRCTKINAVTEDRIFPKDHCDNVHALWILWKKNKRGKNEFFVSKPNVFSLPSCIEYNFFFFFSYPKPSPITKTRDESTERIYAFYQFRCNNTRGFLQPFPVQSSDFRPLLTRDVPSISVSETVQSVRTFLKRVVESAAFGQ